MIKTIHYNTLADKYHMLGLSLVFVLKTSMLPAFLMFILRPFQRVDALNLKDFSRSFRLVFGTFNILVLLLLWLFLPWSTNLIKPFRYSGQELSSILYTWIPSKYFLYGDLWVASPASQKSWFSNVIFNRVAYASNNYQIGIDTFFSHYLPNSNQRFATYLYYSEYYISKW